MQLFVLRIVLWRVVTVTVFFLSLKCFGLRNLEFLVMYLFSLREPGLSLGPGRIEAFPDDTP